MGVVSNSYSEFVAEVEVEGEGEKREVVVDEGREVVAMATGGISGVCVIIGGGRRDRGRLDDGPGGVELATGFVKGCGGHRSVPVK